MESSEKDARKEHGGSDQSVSTLVWDMHDACDAAVPALGLSCRNTHIRQRLLQI